MPPSAARNRPTNSLTAPLNAPRLCPKSSLSIRSRGSAAQLSATKGRPARRGPVDRAGHQLLAGPRLSQHQDRSAVGGDARDLREQALHGRRAPDHAVEEPADRRLLDRSRRSGSVACDVRLLRAPAGVDEVALGRRAQERRHRPVEQQERLGSRARLVGQRVGTAFLQEAQVNYHRGERDAGGGELAPERACRREERERVSAQHRFHRAAQPRDVGLLEEPLGEAGLRAQSRFAERVPACLQRELVCADAVDEPHHVRFTGRERMHDIRSAARDGRLGRLACVGWRRSRQIP